MDKNKALFDDADAMPYDRLQTQRASKDSAPEKQLFNDADAVMDSLRKLPSVLVVGSSDVSGHSMIRGILSVPHSMLDMEVTGQAIDFEAMYRREMLLYQRHVLQEHIQPLVAFIESMPSVNVPDLSDVLPPLPVGWDDEVEESTVYKQPPRPLPGQTVWTVTSVGSNAVTTREVLRGMYKHRQIQRWLAGGKFPKRSRVKVKHG